MSCSMQKRQNFKSASKEQIEEQLVDCQQHPPGYGLAWHTAVMIKAIRSVID